MNILLFGRTGQLGFELERTLAPLGSVLAFGPDELDLTHLDALRAVIQNSEPQVIVNAAAYTAVDKAESEPDRAHAINTEAPRIMAEEARALNSVFVHYSTDFVFDGENSAAYTEQDAVNPLNVYGQTKWKGEQSIGQAGGAYIILRTSWVYSLRGDGFVSKVLRWARNQNVVRVVSDQVGSPTWARTLAEATSLMLARGLDDPWQYFSKHAGVYHLGGAGATSRLDYARLVLNLDPKPQDRILDRLEPALTVDFPTPARRPLMTALDCSKFERAFGIALPAWQDALKLAMAEFQF
ncbi:MAG: dTDP-4-dehydrorhamnose reductase [Chloroflexi bacterium]|nr:dTDP-4-dehydrorhamnose reductase [Chloroflexota bacterium]